MRRDQRPWGPVLPAEVVWSDQGEPFSTRYSDRYFSQDDGAGESQHVFLGGNGLPKRWQTHPFANFCIAETGFGTGLNFLLTWQAWRDSPSKPDIHYIAVEKHPLSKQDLERALSLWPALAPLASELLDAYPGLLPGEHRLLFEGGRLKLDLWWTDADEALEDIASNGERWVDAWYLDGFAPARNQCMWHTTLYQYAAALSRKGATLATFTVAGTVRRGLSEAGFKVTKHPGFGRKRECLQAALENSHSSAADIAGPHWDLPEAQHACPESAIVLGGGLAGCVIAAALARRGVLVTLVEQGKLADGASGIDRGVLYTRLSKQHSSLADFASQSFRFANRYYRGLFSEGLLNEGIDGELCGCFQQIVQSEKPDALAAMLTGLEDFVQVLSASDASRKIGIAQDHAGYWFPESGWLCPKAVCAAATSHQNIVVLEHCGEVILRREGSHWKAYAGTASLATGQCAIVAAGHAGKTLQQLDWLPAQRIRGQITRLPTSPDSAGLRAVLCHEGYMTPARDQHHIIGATYDIGETESACRAADHRHNLNRLAKAVPQWHNSLASVTERELDGYVGFRYASPDYLPMVGPVPDLTQFIAQFSQLRKNAKSIPSRKGPYQPGLYLTTAHGSRGLVSTPLASEILAGQICNEPLPVNRALARALSPARFIIRDLSRNRI
ncbi:MAG: bifunctional tRNA (5-methylaminomethyl-2-thiouridine)(34)-methyltransferase MnmD/FAD-dependent 5-carboxymethylaminomethyl-2-thiouridine(34) oxidoreductase MnmC [Halioglobus sp.]|nr:bifunctional tRNA (5-methylaminomethyl-2-thiouridine)(34)-methyltransferase MnmD/FAD-dependent 5-carboxymethylaminomethyl-2-thiouridine(34) oxidoreductase MnmC [Halioglobus sp.]